MSKRRQHHASNPERFGTEFWVALAMPSVFLPAYWVACRVLGL